MSKKLFNVSDPVFSSDDMTMSTGTRVYLQKDGLTQVLKAKSSGLASERRRVCIGYYNAMKAQHGIVKAAEMQDEYLQSFEYKKRGPIIYTKVDDSWKPIYVVGTGPLFVNKAWFTTNHESVKRLRTQKSLESAEAKFNEFVLNYTPSKKLSDWYNTMIADTRSIFAEQYAKVAAANS